MAVYKDLSASVGLRMITEDNQVKSSDWSTPDADWMFATFQVRKANRERSMLTNSQKREIGLATMLLCVVAVFFIFNILAMVVNIFEAANILVDEMTRVSNLLVSLNSSVNFIIYCIFGDKFQRLFLRHFCCAWVRRSMSGRCSPDIRDDMSAVSGHFTSTNGDNLHLSARRAHQSPGKTTCIPFMIDFFFKSILWLSFDDVIEPVGHRHLRFTTRFAQRLSLDCTGT